MKLHLITIHNVKTSPDSLGKMSFKLWGEEGWELKFLEWCDNVTCPLATWWSNGRGNSSWLHSDLIANQEYRWPRSTFECLRRTIWSHYHHLLFYTIFSCLTGVIAMVNETSAEKWRMCDLQSFIQTCSEDDLVMMLLARQLDHLVCGHLQLSLVKFTELPIFWVCLFQF